MDQEQEKKGLLSRLRDNYLLVVRNEETFEEVSTYRLNLLNVYLVLSTLLLTLLVVSFFIIAFTPLKTLMPGYGKIEDQKPFIKLKKDYNDLQKHVDAQQTYINAFRRLLTDDPESISDVMNRDSLEVASDTEVVRSAEDEKLRQQVENEKIVAYFNEQGAGNSDRSNIPLDQIVFSPPLRGEISARFQLENEHLGIDIMAPENSPIKATLDGIVISSDWTFETGNTIAIQHDYNMISFYKHNSALLKKVGEKVKAGEVVAIIGNTGTLTSGPHLHFELWLDGSPVDPEEFVDF